MKIFPFSVYCLASCVIRPYETKDFFVKSSSHSDIERKLVIQALQKTFYLVMEVIVTSK